MSYKTVMVESGLGRGFPQVLGRCPACGAASLFLAVGGFVTCAIIGCPDPTAAGDLLERQGADNP